MRIYDKSEHTENVIGKITVKKILREGGVRETEGLMINEHQMDIFLNEDKIMSLMCSKEYLSYLVLGYMISEGICEGTEGIESISVCENGRQVRVLADLEIPLENAMNLQKNSCTGNRSFWKTNRPLKKINRISNKPAEYRLLESQMFGIIDCFAKDKELHRATGGTHSCYLFYEGKLIFSCEDLSRHNALDKVIGFLYAEGINVAETAVFTTGRISVDMAEKVIRAGIPFLITKAVPTLDAVLLAKEYGLSLICRAWPDSYEIYS